jgi:hypothetical protein
MPIHVVWDNPQKNIIRWDFKGAWTPADWHSCVARALEMRASVIDTPVVSAIFNMEHSASVPLNILAHGRVAAEQMDKRDFVVVVRASGFMRSIVEIFRTLNPSLADKVMLAQTIEEARAIIASRQAVV